MRAWLIATGFMTAALYFGVMEDWDIARGGAYPGASYWYGWFAAANLIYFAVLYVVERARFRMVANRFLTIWQEGFGMLLFVLVLTLTLVGVSSYGVAAAVVLLSVGTMRREAACGGLCGMPGFV
ncbi:MAG: hypothetical protein AB7G39_03735 [Alphaproteobacteria bacterium]